MNLLRLSIVFLAGLLGYLAGGAIGGDSEETGPEPRVEAGRHWRAVASGERHAAGVSSLRSGG